MTNGLSLVYGALLLEYIDAVWAIMHMVCGRDIYHGSPS